MYEENRTKDIEYCINNDCNANKCSCRYFCSTRDSVWCTGKCRRNYNTGNTTLDYKTTRELCRSGRKHCKFQDRGKRSRVKVPVAVVWQWEMAEFRADRCENGKPECSTWGTQIRKEIQMYRKWQQRSECDE